MIRRANIKIEKFNGLLSSREKGEEYLKESIEKSLSSREKNVLWTNQKKWYSNYYRKEEKPREISRLKEDWQALDLFLYSDKKETFSYPLTIYPIAISKAQQETFYKPYKYVYLEITLLHS